MPSSAPSGGPGPRHAPDASLGFASRLARRLFLWTLVAGAIVSAAVTLVEARLHYGERILAVEQRLQSIGDFALPSLVQSAWTFDHAHSQLQIDGIARLPDVTEVWLDIASAPGLRAGHRPTSGETIQRRFRLVHEQDGAQREVGMLTLTRDLSDERESAMRDALIALAGNGAVVVLTLLMSLVIFQALVTRRVLALADASRNITADDLRHMRREDAAAADPVVPVRDELDELANSIAALERTGAQALGEADFNLSRARSLMDAIPDLVWMKDAEGRYLMCNPGFERFFGARQSDIVGKTDHDFVDAALADSFRANDQAAIAAGGRRSNEEWLTFAEGGYRGLFETTKVPLRTPDGQLLGVLGLAHDVTAWRNAQAELAQHRTHLSEIVAQRTAELELANHHLVAAKKAGEAAHRTKGALPANMGHETRTPPNATEVRVAPSVDSVAEMAANRGAGAAPPASDPQAMLARDHCGARVLLAEDEPINREIACAMLEDAGLVVDVAEDGLRALEMVRVTDYALILMDMQMPNMDGLDATRAIRALPRGTRPPIIAMTANAYGDDRRRCEAASMDDFLTKPVEPQHLYATLNRWLSAAPRA